MIVQVALVAGERRVRARQRDLCRSVVIEFGPRPLRRIVTQSAILWESCRNMIRILRSVEILEVAGGAGVRGQIKVVVDVAGGAGNSNVRARQRKRRRVVIEFCPGPTGSGMAQNTVGRKLALYVVRIRGGIKIHRMAAVAVRRCSCKSPVHMAGIAGYARMGAGQRKFGEGIVVEFRAGPADGRMTDRALLGKAGTHVIGILG